MDFGFNDEQQAIKETAREMLAKRSPMSKVRGSSLASERSQLWRNPVLNPLSKRWAAAELAKLSTPGGFGRRVAPARRER